MYIGKAQVGKVHVDVLPLETPQETISVQRCHHLAVFLQCQQRGAARKSAMLRSLLNQTYPQDPGVRSLVISSYKEKSNAFGGDDQGWNWQQADLEVLLERTVLEAASPVVILIDGVDRAITGAASGLANFLYRMSECSKICISCAHILCSYLLPAP
ncbi:hypothetical protein BJX99DRAFT_226722 [Aspergillus californicus]